VVKENYYERKAREAHDAVERRSRDAHGSMEQRMHGKQPDARDTPRYKQGGEGDSTPEPLPKHRSKPKRKEATGAAASSELLMVSLSAVIAGLGAVAAEHLFGGRNNT